MQTPVHEIGVSDGTTIPTAHLASRSTGDLSKHGVGSLLLRGERKERAVTRVFYTKHGKRRSATYGGRNERTFITTPLDVRDRGFDFLSPESERPRGKGQRPCTKAPTPFRHLPNRHLSRGYPASALFYPLPRSRHVLRTTRFGRDKPVASIPAQNNQAHPT